MKILPALLLALFASTAWTAEIEITGSTTLTWRAPTENVDGSPLTDLAGYNVYMGRESRAYTTVLPVNDAGSTASSLQIPISDENDTQWFFAMTALDAEGNESAYSNEILKTLTITVTDSKPPAPPLLEDVTLDLECSSDDAWITCEVSVQ